MYDIAKWNVPLETANQRLLLVILYNIQFKNIETGLYNKRNKSLGLQRLFGKSPTDVQVSNNNYTYYTNTFGWGLCPLIRIITKWKN